MPRTLSEQEFKAIEDTLIRQAPAGLSEQDFERWIGPRLDGAVAEAEHSNAPVSGSALRRYVANAGEMLNPVEAAKGLYQAVRHPIDTVGNVVTAQAEQFGKAAERWQQPGIAPKIQAVGHSIAGVLPLLGPVAAQAGEQGASGDVAGMLGTATGLLAPIGAPSAIRAGVRAVPNRAATAFERGAADRVADVMSPKVGQNKQRFGNNAEAVAPRIAKDIAKDGAPWTREGLHADVGTRLKSSEHVLDAAHDARFKADTFDTKPMIDDLLKKRQQFEMQAVEGSLPARTATHRASSIVDESGKPFTVTDLKRQPLGKDTVPAPSNPRVAMIDQAIEELRRLGPVTRYDEIRKMRQSYDGPAKAIYSPSMTADYMKAQGGKLGAADVTGTLRDTLGKWDPKTAAANAEYHVYRTADDVLEATREIERTRPRVGRIIAMRIFGTAFGGLGVGPAGAAAGYFAAPLLDAAASSGFTIKLQVARLQTQLAQAIRGGNVSRVNGIVGQLRALTKLAPQGGLVIEGLETGSATARGDQEPTPAPTTQR